MTQYMHSLAHLAVLAESTVAAVERIIREIGAQPAMVLNLTAYYDGEVCGTVVARAKGWTDQPAYHKTFFQEIQADVD